MMKCKVAGCNKDEIRVSGRATTGLCESHFYAWLCFELCLRCGKEQPSAYRFSGFYENTCIYCLWKL